MRNCPNCKIRLDLIEIRANGDALWICTNCRYEMTVTSEQAWKKFDELKNIEKKD